MAARTKAQVILPSVSGLPSDVFINTFHFVTDANSAVTGGLIISRLRDFYNTANTTADLASYLGNTIDRGADACLIKLYDEIDNNLPPYLEGTMTLDASGQASDLPWEVACCASFKNLSVTTVPERNRRGRVFLGPLNQNAVVEAGGSIRPRSEFIVDILDAMERLFNANTAAALWTVYSKVQVEGYVVEAGWVDNSFDTQRRRGEPTTARSSRTF